MRIWVQKSASMQKRTSPLKFAHLAEKSEEGSISNLSTTVANAGADAGADAGAHIRADAGADAGADTGADKEANELFFLENIKF